MELITLFLDEGYHLYIDRFYSSVLLAKELEARNTWLTGTLNSNRVDLPEVIKSTAKNKFSLSLGGYRAFHHGRSLAMAWKPEKKNFHADNRVYIKTYHNYKIWSTYLKTWSSMPIISL